MPEELNAFLGADDGATPAPSDAPAGAASPPAPEAPLDETSGGQPAAEPRPAPAVDPGEDDPNTIPEDVRGLRAAVQAERVKRNDHKGRADRAEGELAATKAALEAARKAAAAPPAPVAAPAAPVPAPAAPPAPIAVPNPMEDPAGYHAYHQRMLFNERLNTSEAMLRESLKDDADVDVKMAAFKKAAADNPQLRVELNRQAHPYKWAYEQGKKMLALDEIGADPAAYRNRVEQEIRDAIAAEQAGVAPPARPAMPVIPRSLATVPSSAPRMQQVQDAPAFEDIFKRAPRR